MFLNKSYPCPGKIGCLSWFELRTRRLLSCAPLMLKPHQESFLLFGGVLGYWRFLSIKHPLPRYCRQAKIKSLWLSFVRNWNLLTPKAKSWGKNLSHCPNRAVGPRFWLHRWITLQARRGNFGLTPEKVFEKHCQCQ